MFFLWDDWNEGHVGKHDIDPDEAEFVVRHAKRPYPRRTSSVKWLVKGRTRAGRLIQVIYVMRDARQIDIETLSLPEKVALEGNELAIYIIHARSLRRGEG